jgi:hypothetical protein
MAILVMALLLAIIYPVVEQFNTRQSRIALYDNPHQCPYNYVDLYKDPLSGDKFVVESKLKGQPRKELDNVYRDVNNFQESWTRLGHVFPNLYLCSDPYQNYLASLRRYYQGLSNVPSLNLTTTPIYYKNEAFQSSTAVEPLVPGVEPLVPGVEPPPPTTQQERRDRGAFDPVGLPVELPLEPSTTSTVDVRVLNRTVDNPSQLNASTYMLPNSPILSQNEQIDTSVMPADDRIPITLNVNGIKQFKDQMMVNQFEQQSNYQKQIYQLAFENEQLKREMEEQRNDIVKRERTTDTVQVGQVTP